jgi:hypothetical protein
VIDHPQGTKKDVAEIKFLIHDLRVESFINEIIHYAVKSFSADETILEVGKEYIETIYDISELVLNPRWGRASQVLSFLPEDSRCVRSYPQYLNSIRWICGVQARIRHFMEEKDNKNLYEEFDVSDELQDFVRNVIYGYVTEKSSARVAIQLDRLDSAVLGGNRYRFRRMFFNLVMNAVDAMGHRSVGVLNVSDVVEGKRVVLRVRDNGSGMTPEKIEQLLVDKKSLDGELHSLGFVFVRQTVEEFAGELSIDSEIDKGTTIAISLPYLEGVKAAPRQPSECEDLGLLREIDEVRLQGRTAYAKKVATPADDRHNACGEMVYADYMISDAQFPGSIFGIGVAEDDKIDFFTHRPYERHWNITHEDLSPMFFEATVRGRVEEEEDKTPVLILKAPQNVREYFEFREVPDERRTQETYAEMVHDEYIRIARKLIATGMSPQIGVRLTDLQKFFAQQKALLEVEPFPLEMLAKQNLTTEKEA